MKRRRRQGLLFTAFLATTLLLSAAMACHSENNGPWNKTALTSVAGITNLDAPRDLDDPGIGGGVDSTTYFRTRLLPKLADCTDRIEAEIMNWTKLHSMAIPKREQVPGNLLVHATNETLRGLFEFIYRVDRKREKARVTLYFYSADGARHELTGIKGMLQSYEIAALQDKLDAALRCGTG